MKFQMEMANVAEIIKNVNAVVGVRITNGFVVFPQLLSYKYQISP